MSLREILPGQHPRSGALLLRVPPTKHTAGPLATIDNKAIPLIKICIFQAIALYLHV